MSFTENNEETKLVEKFERALLDLKKDYMDRRINPDLKQERDNINSEYMRGIMESDNINQHEKINAESKRKGFEDRFLNNPEFRRYGRELVESNMKNLTDAVDNHHLAMIWQLTHDKEQSLRAIDQGIDPTRNIEYEDKKHEIELNEKGRLENKWMLIRIKREREYKAQAEKEAETFQRSRNTFPWDSASGHRYGA